MRSEARLQRIEQLTELPLLVLAIVMIPLLLLPAVTDLSESVEQAFLAGDWFIWAAFAVDYVVTLTVAPRPLSYVRSHWLEALIVVLPLLRPLRAARLLRVGRLGALLGLNVQLANTFLQQRGTKFILGAVLATAVGGATLAFLAERQATDANIVTFGDSLWWAVATVTTVGYGDHVPVTALGRGVAAALMLFGIATVSALTATIAAYLVKENEEQEVVQLQDVMYELRELREEVRRLRSEA
jgi:voltage-gated potassium channel